MNGCRLYLLKGDFSLSYWRGALDGAFYECAQFERTLGLPPEEHTNFFKRLEQFKMLIESLEEVVEEVDHRQTALHGDCGSNHDHQD